MHHNSLLLLLLDLDELIQHLERADFPSSDIVDIVMRKTGCNEKALIGSMLKVTRPLSSSILTHFFNDATSNTKTLRHTQLL